MLQINRVTCFLSICLSALQVWGSSTAFKSIDLTGAPKSIFLPQEMMEKIGTHSKDVTEKKMFSIWVQLLEKTHQSLGGSNLEIAMPEGGGRLDLASYVKPGGGSFYFKVKVPDDIDVKKLKVHFLSGSSRREIDNVVWGAGCNEFFDLTTFFLTRILPKGLLVFNSQERYVNTLAGTYVFSVLADSTLNLSQLTVIDSRHMNLQCQRF